LLYAAAKKAYIYRPSINRVVDIQPITVDSSASQVQGARILVLNGAGNKDQASKLAQMIERNYPSAQHNPIRAAQRQDYPTTIIIDLTDGTKYDLVANMMQVLGAQRGVLPQGEPKPENLDIIVLTGLDKNT
jgi:hypothetical protein